jgi:hypothetical protein
MLSSDLIIIEGGSTLTKATALAGIGSGVARIMAQAQALTTVREGDAMLGVETVLSRLKESLNGAPLPAQMLACSSAAGGLRMAAIGLARDMTVRAAKEACLGAGAVLKYVQAGKMKARQFKQMLAEKPSVILLAGGTDGGDEETVLHNAGILAQSGLQVPLIYAGNKECVPEIQELLKPYPGAWTIVPNVYPEVDELNILPARQEIQRVFSIHIVKAPGMQRLRERIQGQILPVPAAVLICAEKLAEQGEEILVIDVGGATTDVHSVTDGNAEFRHMALEPQPRSKRTVEGDLGVYINAEQVMKEAEGGEVAGDLKDLSPLPAAPAQRELSLKLGRKAVHLAVRRHAGKLVERFTATGKANSLVGKDLTAITLIVGTGGFLTRLPGAAQILAEIPKPFDGRYLLPQTKARLAIDQDYIFSAAGVLALSYPAEALALAKKSINNIL